MFIEQQINILEWFLKDHVTLKTDTEVKVAEFFKYIKMHF